MSLILLCGVDRTGKTTVANYYNSIGYEVIHLSTPDKSYFHPLYSGKSYFQYYVDMLENCRNKDVVFDRFWDGELVWPTIFGREALLTLQEIEHIRLIERKLHPLYILMEDPDRNSHWQRCLDNNEPINQQQFNKAIELYEKIANQYGFERMTLSHFDAVIKK
jgi:thymidylate kinase